MRVGPPGPPGAPGRSARPPKAIIFSITLTGIMANTLIAPAIPDILDGLGISDSAAGLLVGAATLPGIAVAPLIGLLADRYGRREVVVPCLALFGLFGGLASFAPGFGALLACRLLQGVGSAGLINLAVVIIADHWDGTERAHTIGLNSAVLTVSLAVLPLLGGGLTDLGGWRATFVPYWLGLVTAVAVWRVLPRSPHRDVRIGEQVREAVGFLRNGAVVASMVSGVVIFVLIFGLFLTVLPLHLEREFGLGATARGALLGLPAIGSTSAALLLGRMVRRVGVRPLVLASSALFAVAFVVVGLAPALPLLVVGALIYGWGEGLTIPSLQDIVAGAAPASSRGSVFAMWVGGARAGQTIGPVVAGALAGSIGTGGTFVAGGALALALLGGQLATGQPRPVDPGPAS